jgi:hypothetical protein
VRGGAGPRDAEAASVTWATHAALRFTIGRGDWIRTSDLLNPIQVRYQTALRPVPLLLRFWRNAAMVYALSILVKFQLRMPLE